MSEALLVEGFDEALFEGGVEDGAFSGEKDAEAKWYILKVSGENVALANAAPGPGDLTTISYYVDPERRGHGYGTKIASRVTDLHKKATFTIFKDNEASIKVALAALKNKFSVTMGHNVVRLTKEASENEKKAIDPFLLTAIGLASLGGALLGNKLGLKIRKFLDRHRKQAASRQSVMLLARSRQLSRAGKMPTGYRLEEAAKSIAKLPEEKIPYSKAKSGILVAGKRVNPELESRIRKAISEKIGPQKELFR